MTLPSLPGIPFGVLLLALLLPYGGAGQEAGEGTVKDLLALRWGIPIDRVHLEWGGDEPPADSVVTLVSGGGGGWVVVEVRQPGGEVTRRSIRVGVHHPVQVATRSLARGVVLTEDDLAPGTLLRWGPPGEMEGVEVGWELRRAVRVGEPILPPAAAPPTLVTSGTPVEVVVREGPVHLTLSGEARSTGARGDRVRVRLPSGRVVWAQVDGESRVTLAR